MVRFLDVVNLLNFGGEVVGESETFEFPGGVEDANCRQGFLDWVGWRWNVEVVDFDLLLMYHQCWCSKLFGLEG